MRKSLISVEAGGDPIPITSVASITIAIAGTSAILSDKLEELVGNGRGLCVVSVCDNAEQTIKMFNTINPDVLVLDTEMEGCSDVIRNKPEQTNVLLLIAEGKTAIVRAIKLGCSGILRAQTSPKLIVDSIPIIHSGEVCFDAEIAAAMSTFAAPQWRGPARNSDTPNLSERELQIVQLVSQGYRNWEIAQQMGICEQTVKNQLHVIFGKLGVSDRLDLALYAVYKEWHLKPAVTSPARTGSAPTMLRSPEPKR